MVRLDQAQYIQQMLNAGFHSSGLNRQGPTFRDFNRQEGSPPFDSNSIEFDTYAKSITDDMQIDNWDNFYDR